ncbi:MAG: hypothetical protein ABSF45_15325 [Terriglobia bacterium]
MNTRCGHLGRPPRQALLSPAAIRQPTDGGLMVVLPVLATMPSEVISEFDPGL